MEATCRQALAAGLPAIAFTEHADFTPWVTAERAAELRRAGGLPHGTRPIGSHHKGGAFDAAGYWDAIDRCRSLFPALRIRSGVELGEAHRFTAEAAAILSYRPLDLVLGSLHCIPLDGELADMSAQGMLTVETAVARLRTYFAEVLDLVEQSSVFAVLAHLDYPKRYWPFDRLGFDEHDFEEEYRSVLRALARSGRALEVNTSRGADPKRGLCPGPIALRWWYEEGGAAVSFGSDAHSPDRVMSGFALATEMATAAGFRAAADPAAFWLR